MTMLSHRSLFPRHPSALAALIALSAVAYSAAAQTTRFVAPCGNNAWTGTSEECAAPNGPKRTIQAAVNASATGDTIIVEDGTYTGPGNRDIDFGGRNIAHRGRN